MNVGGMAASDGLLVFRVRRKVVVRDKQDRFPKGDRARMLHTRHTEDAATKRQVGCHRGCVSLWEVTTGRGWPHETD